MNRQRMLRQWLLTGLALCLMTSHVRSASLQYTLPGTAVTFADSGGTVAFVQSNRGAGTGQYSDRYNKGTGAQPSLWEMRCQISLTGTNTAGQAIEYYISTSDGTIADGGLGTTGSSLAADKRRNLLFAGLLIVDQTTTNTTMSATFRNLYIPSQYFSVAMWNGTALSTETSTTKHKCVAYPMPFQMQ